MGNNSAKHHYETAKKTGTLSLCNCSLNEFPGKMKELGPILRQLNLSNNKFQVLPTQISNFSNLKSIKIDNNRLICLPEEIGKLNKLENISAGSNRISKLPCTLSLLVNLKEINLSNNYIITFPVSLCDLKHLTIIDLSKNQISEIPKDIARVNVTELNVNENRISIISPEIAKAPKLKILKMEYNQLKLQDIPKALLTDSKISSLFLTGNLFNIKDIEHVDGYEKYMERYTETKKKMF